MPRAHGAARITVSRSNNNGLGLREGSVRVKVSARWDPSQIGNQSPEKSISGPLPILSWLPGRAGSPRNLGSPGPWVPKAPFRSIYNYFLLGIKPRPLAPQLPTAFPFPLCYLTLEAPSSSFPAPNCRLLSLNTAQVQPSLLLPLLPFAPYNLFIITAYPSTASSTREFDTPPVRSLTLASLSTVLII